MSDILFGIVFALMGMAAHVQAATILPQGFYRAVVIVFSLCAFIISACLLIGVPFNCIGLVLSTFVLCTVVTIFLSLRQISSL